MSKEIYIKDLRSLIIAKDAKKIAEFLKKNSLTIKDSKILPKNKESVDNVSYWISYWNQRNISRKINLNALYGAVSNVGSKFSDQRIGQSTTLTGRTIAKYMNAKVNEILTGDFAHDGKAIVYFDTDSSYFSINSVLDNLKENGYQETKEAFIEMSDNIAGMINESFPGFTGPAFNVSKANAALIKCGREICAVSGLFPTKKRYAILVYDKEGDRQDKDGALGKIKITGMDIIRADTPPSVQDFLKEVMLKVLSGESETEVVTFIREFRNNFRESSPWELGSPKRVNNLTKYGKKVFLGTKSMVPGHVSAALAWNKLRELNGDNFSSPILDGGKILVCSLKPNPLKVKSVAFPVDEKNLPKWFTSLPFDTSLMEEKLIDNKLDNIIGTLKWNLKISKMSDSFTNLFTLE